MNAPRFLPPFVAALSLLRSLPMRGGAQVAAGDTVRTLRGDSLVAFGILLRSDSTTRAIRSIRSADTLHLGPGDYRTAEVLLGQRRRGMSAVGRGAMVGAGITLALGAASMLASDGHPHN